MRRGELAETRGETLLALVSQRLAAEEQCLVLQQRCPEQSDRVVAEVVAKIHAEHLGADASSDPPDVEISTDDGHCSP